MTKIKWKQIIFSSLLLGIIPISTLNINEYKSSINQNIKNELINLDSTDFLTKLKNDNVQKLNSNQYVGFRLNDINNSTSQNVFIPNDNLIYDPSRLVSLKNQIVNATNEIDNKMVASFVNESELIINELNNFVVIEGVKPFLEYLPVWDPLKAKEPWSSVQNFKFKYSASSIYGTGESDWITEDPNVFFQNQVGRTYNTFTVLINFVPLMGEIKLEVPAGYKQSKLFVPANISSPNENGEFTFKVGNKGSDYFDMSNIINMNNSAFRTGFVIKAKYLPKLKINTSDLSISNLDYNVPQNNLYDPRYSYLYLKNENDWNLLKDCSEFLSYREQKINLLIKLKESSKYKPYIDQYLSDSLNITNNQIASEVKIVSDKYKIQQYSHLVPTNIYNSYSSYTISNNTLNDIRYYSNVSNLIADQIILDPNYGVKQQNKNSDSVYDKTDYENLALVFKFKNNFLDLLNLIDNYNYLLLNVRSKLMSVLNEEELKKILIPLWSFKYDLREFNNNIDDLINKLENQLWEEDKNNVVIEKINKIFNQNYLINNENLMFFHDLPLLFKNFYDQLTIQATISYVDQPSKIINIFENKNFNSINFDDETLSLNKKLRK